MSDLTIINPESHWVTVQMSSKQLTHIRWLAEYHIRSSSNIDAIVVTRALLVQLEDYQRPPLPPPPSVGEKL